MITIIGVRFRCAGKIYYFDPGELEIEKNSKVVVETARGLELGTVVVSNKQVEEDSVVQPLKPVIRVATEEDLESVEKNKEKEKEAFQICQEKIAKHGLEMKLVDVEYTFDNNKILFYFTADGRIDFRELVKDLASVFKTRIELRQIGVRDETKIKGGIGICGRCLCCASYLSEFIPVSIKMAKEQNLSLNPTKISGVCGRLMCCLKNEEETYEYLNSRLPAIGDVVTHMTDGTKGTVHSVNILRQTVKVVVNLDGDDVEAREYSIDELRYKPRRKKDKNSSRDEEEDLKELEELERKEKREGRESRDEKESGERREHRENREHRERREPREGREHREGREPREGREYREGRESREGREHREGRNRREGKEHRRNHEGMTAPVNSEVGEAMQTSAKPESHDAIKPVSVQEVVETVKVSPEQVAVENPKSLPEKVEAEGQTTPAEKEAAENGDNLSMEAGSVTEQNGENSRRRDGRNRHGNRSRQARRERHENKDEQNPYESKGRDRRDRKNRREHRDQRENKEGKSESHE